MKIFVVDIQRSIMVVAEDERDAESVALSNEREESPDLISAHEVKGLEQVPKEWRDTIPYGENEDGKTIRQIMTEPAAPPPFVDPPEQLRFGFSGGTA